MLARWTRVVLRFRWPVIGFWIVVLVVGLAASTNLSSLLSNTFTVPGTDSERARTILQDHFGERSDGEFLLVFRVPEGTSLRDLQPAWPELHEPSRTGGRDRCAAIPPRWRPRP